MQETVDSYTKQMDTIIKTMPSNYFYSVTANVTDVFLNYEATTTIQPSHSVKYIWSAISANMEDNTILGVTFTPSNTTDVVTVHWKSKYGDQAEVELTDTISAYCSKQFLFSTTGNNLGGTPTKVSGFMRVND